MFSQELDKLPVPETGILKNAPDEARREVFLGATDLGWRIQCRPIAKASVVVQFEISWALASEFCLCATLL